jgi:hypothetical protein
VLLGVATVTEDGVVVNVYPELAQALGFVRVTEFDALET